MEPIFETPLGDCRLAYSLRERIMKILGIILDIFCVTVSAILIIKGDGDFGDYLWVGGALFTWVFYRITTRHKSN